MLVIGKVGSIGVAESNGKSASSLGSDTEHANGACIGVETMSEANDGLAIAFSVVRGRSQIVGLVIPCTFRLILTIKPSRRGEFRSTADASIRLVSSSIADMVAHAVT
jgi:hypothetical protein